MAGDSLAEVCVIPASRSAQELNCCCEVRAASGRRCVVAAGQGGVIARDVESGKVVGRADAAHEILCITGRDDTVWLGDTAGHVVVYRVDDDADAGADADGASGRKDLELLLRDESSHASAVMLIITSGDLVISASDDGSVCEWSSWAQASQPILPPSDVMITALTSTSNTIIIADITGTTKSVDTYTHTIQSWQGHAGAILALKVVLLLQLWSAGEDGQVLVRSLPDGSLLKTFAFDAPVTSITCVGDKVWLWCSDGALTLVSPLTLECADPIMTDRAPVGVVQVAQADVRRVWAPCANGSIGVWDVRCTGMDDLVHHVAQEGDLARRQVKALEAKAEEAGGGKEKVAAQEGEAGNAQQELTEERQRSEDLETTVKGLVAHCTELQESLYAREKEVIELTKQRDRARADRDAAETESVALQEEAAGQTQRINDLKEDYAGVEDQAIAQQELVEEMQRMMLFGDETSERRRLAADATDALLSAHRAQAAEVAGIYQEELLAREAVNRSLRLHVDGSRPS